MVCLVVETVDCNRVLERLEVMPALIRTWKNIGQIRIIGSVLWDCIIEAAQFERRCGCMCTAGSHVQFACAKMGIAQDRGQLLEIGWLSLSECHPG